MPNIRIGEPDVSPDLMAHTPGVPGGNSIGNYDKQAGHHADGRSNAKRSTGINSEGMEPIDPRMPNLSPG